MFLFPVNRIINQSAVVGKDRNGKKFQNTNLG